MKILKRKVLAFLLLFSFSSFGAGEPFVYMNSAGGYSSSVLCERPWLHIRQFGPCPYYPIWEYEVRFNFKKEENHELSRRVHNIRFEALRGDRYAQFLLAGYYERGVGVKRDLSRAYGWMKTAAENGLDIAQYKLERWQNTMSEELLERGEKQALKVEQNVFSTQSGLPEESLPDEVESNMLFSQKRLLSR